MRAAVLEGLGIAHNASWLYAKELASVQVVRVLQDFQPDAYPIHAVSTAGRRMPLRARVFVDFLADICAAEPELRIA
jgi:LysR family transcriptional regulator for bpeEF and oprC